MAAPDPAVVERQMYVDMYLNGVDDPSLTLAQLRDMGAGAVHAHKAAQAHRANDLNPGHPFLRADDAAATYETKVDADAESAARVADTANIRANTMPAIPLEGTGIDPTGVADSTAALQTLVTSSLAAGATRFVGKAGATYKVTVPEGQSLFSLTNTKGISFDLSSSSIVNNVSYVLDTLTPIWLLNNCKDTTILLKEYVGFVLPTPAVHLGYRGATLVRAINGTDGVTINARAQNLRYGVQSGEYGNATVGQCKNFDVSIRGTMIGYPIALYYADGVRHDIEVDGVHRGVYLAGVNDVTGVLRWKNQYIADTAYLITDTLISGTDAAAQIDPVGAATVSRGCHNINATVIDMGSDVFQLSSRCAGIGLQRVDPCEFKNINLTVYSKATATKSTRVGGFIITSGAKAVQTRYPFNWEPHIVLENITVSGIIDHTDSADTGNSGSELYVLMVESTHYGTLRNFKMENFTFLKSATHTRLMQFSAPGMAAPASFKNYSTPGVGLSVYTNNSVGTTFDGCTIGSIDHAPTVVGGCKIELVNGTVITSNTINGIADAVGQLQHAFVSTGSTIGGAGVSIKQKEATVNLTGTTVTITGLIPAASILLGVGARVQGLITGSTGYQLGVTGDLARFANRNDLNPGLAIGPGSQAATEISPRYYIPTTDMLVTSKTAAFTGGILKVVVWYIAFTPPSA